MNYTIHFLTIFTIVPHLSLFGQSADPTAETVEVQGQNRNQAVQTTTSGQPVNNRSTTRAVNRQNQQPNGYGSGGIGAAGYAYRVHNVLSRFPGTAENPLLVRSLDMNAKDVANLQEDLAVMQHILDKALDDLPGGQARAQTAMGINVFVTPNSSAMRSL